MKTTTIRMGAIALACSAMSGLAFADMYGTTTVSKAVRYDPAVVQTGEGAAALYAKLQSAAQYVCTTGTFALGVDRRAEAKCASEALTRAVQDVNSPTLDAVHAHRRGSVEVVASR